MIGRKAEAILNRAVRYAVEREHEYFTLEHVLWSLLGDSEISDALAACGGDPGLIRKELEAYLQTEIPKAARNESGTKSDAPRSHDTHEIHDSREARESGDDDDHSA